MNGRAMEEALKDEPPRGAPRPRHRTPHTHTHRTKEFHRIAALIPPRSARGHTQLTIEKLGTRFATLFT